jgi:hypothetical protein
MRLFLFVLLFNAAFVQPSFMDTFLSFWYGRSNFKLKKSVSNACDRIVYTTSQPVAFEHLRECEMKKIARAGFDHAGKSTIFRGNLIFGGLALYYFAWMRGHKVGWEESGRTLGEEYRESLLRQYARK